MTQRYYPSQADLQGTDKLERVVRDIYDRVYALQPGGAVMLGSQRTRIEQNIPPATVQRLHSYGVFPPGNPATASVIKYGTYANRPTAAQEQSYKSFYWATDQNTLYFCEETTWAWIGGMMEGTLTPDQRPSLAAEDEGFLFHATDTLRIYRWDGAAWQFYVPDASTSYAGLVTTGVQSFAGNKTFTDNLTVDDDVVLGSDSTDTTTVNALFKTENAVQQETDTITNGTTNADATYNIILCNAAAGTITVNLPAAAGVTGRVYEIKKIDTSTNTVTIDPNGAEEIENDTTALLSYFGECLTIISDGTEWWII